MFKIFPSGNAVKLEKITSVYIEKYNSLSKKGCFEVNVACYEDNQVIATFDTEEEARAYLAQLVDELNLL